MNKKLLIILSIILSTVLITAHLFLSCIFRFDNIVLAEKNIIVNDDNSEIKLFQMSENRLDRAENQIFYKKIFENSDGEFGYNYPLDIAENNGKIYLLNIKYFFSERPAEYEICLLDFKRKKPEIIYSFSEKELENKLKAYLNNDENSYFVCGEKFEIEDDGIILYLAEQSAEYHGKNPVYKVKLIGGEPDSAEIISEYRTDNGDSIMIFGDKILQLDDRYHLLNGGEDSGLPESFRCSELIEYPHGGSDENILIAKDLDTREFSLVDLQNKTRSEFPEIQKFIEENKLKFSDIFDFYIDENKKLALCFDGENGFLFDLDSGKKSEFIYTESILEAVLHSIITAAIAALAVWLGGYLIYFLRARGKVSVKFAALIIPVMLGCDLAAYAVIGLGISTISKHIIQSNLKAVSTHYRSLNLTDNIGDFDLDGEYQNEVGKFIQILVDSEFLKAVYWAEDAGVSADVNFFGYIKNGNSYVQAADIIEGNLDVDILSLLPSKTAEKIQSSIDKKTDSFVGIYDGGLEREFLISPTKFTENDSVNGVFLYSVSVSEVRYRTQRLLNRLMIYKLILSAVISLLFTLSAVFPLRGLKKLQKKSADYLSGGYIPRLSDKKERGGCQNEIDVISEKFDALLNSVYGEFNEIDNLRKANAAYFSDVILKIFNKKTINSIKFGESASVNAYCIKVLLPEKKYSGFDKMNRLLNALGKSLKKHNAFAADIDNTSISVYSLEPGALNILFFFREYDPEIIAAADRCYIDINIVNIGGSCHFNIEPEDPKRAEILMDTLINTGSAIAVTETALEVRKKDLSVICIGMVDNEFICEISDGVKERFANSIRGNLKNGIEKYFHGDKTAARESFVTILKTQQSNSVARYYINLLDEKIGGNEENLQ